MSDDLEKHIKKLKQDKATLLEKIEDIQDIAKAPKLVTEFQAVNNELDPLLGRLNSWWTENRRLRYQEKGHWARHYSTVRMGVITVTITTCVAIIAWKWRTLDDVLEGYVVNAVALLWALGVVIFQTFTYYTFKELNRQLVHRAELPYKQEQDPNDASPKQASVCEDVASWAIWVLSALFAYFAFTGANESMHCGFKALLVLTLLPAPLACYAERRLNPAE